MEKIKNLPAWALVVLTFVSFALLSPKWLMPPAAWFAPALLVLLLKSHRLARAFFVCFGVILSSSLVANYKVMPFPGIFFVVMVVVISLQACIPFLVNHFLWSRVKGFQKTLILPCAFVVYDYLTSLGGGGTWGLLANTQIENLAFVQLVSITGVWGISFLLYWWAAIVNWFLEEGFEKKGRFVAIVAATFSLVIVFGFVRLNPFFLEANETVRVAGITGNNLEMVKSIYQHATGKKFTADINRLTQSSPELQELNSGLAAFIEDPYAPKFDHARLDLVAFQDSIFNVAAREAMAGAKVISMSEALLFTTKRDEGDLIERAKLFAVKHQVHFLLAMVSFIPTKVQMGSKYMENKALLIAPDGSLVYTFFKNKPVPVVEGSIAGDGNVPVAATPFGNIATSICYDADFPQLMRKAGQQQADIMLLPSGDWREVSPYHAQMARMRAIENGFSLVRPVSNAQSFAFDYLGRQLSVRNFFDSGEKVLVAYVPTKGTQTIYPVIGDVLVYACGLLLLVLMVLALRSGRVPQVV
ncbi:MAG: nitrilase-related carbon-nitrogen hydrolase [Bacteroidota bacterium]